MGIGVRDEDRPPSPFELLDQVENALARSPSSLRNVPAVPMRSVALLMSDSAGIQRGHARFRPATSRRRDGTVNTAQRMDGSLDAALLNTIAPSATAG